MTDGKAPNLRLITRDTAAEEQRARDRKFQALYAEAMAIEAEDADKAGQIGYVAKWLVHATLPYVQPKGDPPAWGRRSGPVSLLIQPGYYQKAVAQVDSKGRSRGEKYELVSMGYPYGTYPRLILAWLATEVVRTREREIPLGVSLADFMSQIGRTSSTGGARGSITILKTQLQRLLSANIAVTTDPAAVVWQTDGFRIADSAHIELWWNPVQPNQGTLWQSSLKLTEKFYDTLIKKPVPVDLRIIRALSRSALAMDIYSWLTYRNAMLERPTKIAWEALMLQFGTEGTKYKFRENFEKNLSSVLALYPQARVACDSAGVLLTPSPPSIRKLSSS
jgi:hypothetical protein